MNAKTSKALATLLASLAILALVFPSMPVSAQIITLTILPTADAYVSQSYPSSNYGSRTQVRVDGSPIVNSYLRFEVSQINGAAVTSATLRIYANSASSAGLAAYIEPDHTWSENGITYNNAPVFGSQLGETGRITAGTWVTIDVTAAVRGDGEIDFGLGGLSSTAISLGSREDSAHAPQLIITANSMQGATPTETLTPTPTTRPTQTLTASPTASATLTSTTTPALTLTASPNASVTASFTLTLTPTSTSTMTFKASPTSVTQPVAFLPTADAYVNQSYPSSNYGSQTQVRVDGSPIVNSYLRFEVSQINGAAVTSATLRIYANSASSAGLAAYIETDHTWSENGITYNNAPVFGSRLGETGRITAGTWVTIDVTAAVRGDGEVDFGLGGLSNTAISLGSREDSAHAPQLIITANSMQGATPTETFTPTPYTKPTPTLTISPSSTTTITTTPQPEITPTDPVILAAGDIAKCGGGTPSPTSGAIITSNMLLMDSGNILTLGDNSNDSGSLSDYSNCFAPSWGRLTDRLNIAMGNHDIGSNGQDFFAYFTGMTGTWGHYSINLGSWHIIVLNAECGIGGQGCGSGSLQETWLRQDLEANSQKCILAVWHQPLFTSGTQSPYTGVKAFWQDLYAYGADVILNGHNHNYERFDPQNPDAAADSEGIREFVVGTGGASLDKSSLPLAANEVVRSAVAYGYIRLTLHADSYAWQFVAQPGSSFTDSGSAACH